MTYYRWSPILLRPDGLYGTRPAEGGGKAAKLKASDDAPAISTPESLAWQAAGLHCSANERRADEASRDVEAWLKCKYMRDHLGEEFAGMVSSATSFGIFVTLDDMYVEGLVHITELGGEYYRFDEARQELRGERTGMRYAIGSRVRVQVSRVDLDGRRIDFRLVHEGDELASRSGKERAAPRESAPGGDFDTDAARRGAKREGRKPDAAAKRPAKARPVTGKAPGKTAASAKAGRKPRLLLSA